MMDTDVWEPTGPTLPAALDIEDTAVNEPPENLDWEPTGPHTDLIDTAITTMPDLHGMDTVVEVPTVLRPRPDLSPKLPPRAPPPPAAPPEEPSNPSAGAFWGVAAATTLVVVLVLLGFIGLVGTGVLVARSDAVATVAPVVTPRPAAAPDDAPSVADVVAAAPPEPAAAAAHEDGAGEDPGEDRGEDPGQDGIAAAPDPEPPVAVPTPAPQTLAAQAPAEEPYTVLFGFNQWQARLSSGQTAALLAAVEGCADGIEVVGHSCSVGSASRNREFAEARAAFVAGVLQRGGVPRSEITTRSDGATDPAQSNDTPAGRAANRRVTVFCRGAR